MPDRKIAAMYREYGRGWGYKCGDCPWLYKTLAGKKVLYKCAAYGESRSEATDWVKKWEACGLVSGSLPDITTVRRLKNAAEPTDEPVEGQINMFGGESDEPHT